MADNQIKIAELLKAIAAEVKEANLTAQETGAIMQFTDCEIEVGLDIEVKTDGGVHAWVINLGAGAKRTESNIIKIKYSALTGKSMVAEVTAADPSKTKRPSRQGRNVKDEL